MSRLRNSLFHIVR